MTGHRDRHGRYEVGTPCRGTRAKPALMCPDWCAVDHVAQAVFEAGEQTREHTNRAVDVPTVDGRIGVAVSRFDDLEAGSRGPVVVAVGDREMTGAQARLLAAALVVAADVVDGGR